MSNHIMDVLSDPEVDHSVMNLQFIQTQMTVLYFFQMKAKVLKIFVEIALAVQHCPMKDNHL